MCSIKLSDFSEWDCKSNKYNTDRKSIDVNNIGEFICTITIKYPA